MAWSRSMKKPPPATAAVRGPDPVVYAVAAHAAAVVTRCPPGLMWSCAGKARARPSDGRAACDNHIYSVVGPSNGGKKVSQYLAVAIFAGFIVAFGVVSLAAARLLRPSRPDAVKLENYECGAEPIGSAWVQFPIGFYLVALVFIVFDALAVFLFPWALVLRNAGLSALWGMATCVAILGLGWLYAYREGVLEWK